MAVSASSGCFAPPARGICCTPGAIISKAPAPRAAAFLTALLVSLPQLRPTRTAAFLKGIGAPRSMPRPGDQHGPPRPADRPASHTPKRLPALDRSAGNLVSGKGPFPQNREDAMPDLASVLEQARVPEHSAPFMQAMSQGTAFLEGEYLFIINSLMG